MNSFSELNLSETLKFAIEELGYEKPSPIQAQALPILLGEPTDFLGLAATGTGKTAAFSIPMLEKIDAKKKSVQALVLCPTRELALQVAGQINLLGKFKGIQALPIYGGAGYGDQIRGLRDGAQVVVGTPGRVIDHLDRQTLSLQNLSILILDEADEMISMGFKEDLERVLQSAPREKGQFWLFSATMSPDVRRVADTYLRNAKQVQINRTEVLPSTVEQLYYPMRESDKPEILCKIIDVADDFYGIIFCQTKNLVVELTSYLQSRGYKVDCLHGDKSQSEREKTMRAFRDKRVTVLVCTDVASRGLDVKDVTHVINYSIPRELDNYVHRIGRTARSGKSGIAISLVTPSHRPLIAKIEKMTRSRMLEGKIPTRKEVGMKKVGRFLAQFQEQKNFPRVIELLSPEWQTAIANMKSDEIVGRFLNMISPEYFDQQEKAKPLQAHVPTDERGNALPRGGRDDRRGGGRRERFGSDERRERRGFGGRSERRDRNDRGERRERFGSEERSERGERKFIGRDDRRDSRPDDRRGKKFRAGEDSPFIKGGFKNRPSKTKSKDKWANV